MGGWDYYCFLCNAGFDVYLDDLDDGQNDGHPDLDAVQPDRPNMRQLFPRELVEPRLQWLTKFRTIGVNRKAVGIKQCYLSGPATSAVYGDASIQFGDHPNAQGRGENFPGNVTCYMSADGGENDGDLPIHESCLIVLSEAFAQAQGIKQHWTVDWSNVAVPFDLDTLFTALAPLRQPYQSFLNLAHEWEPDQYFDLDWDRMLHYLDPLESDDKDVQAEAGRAVPLGPHPACEEVSQNRWRPGDWFQNLPEELTVAIADILPEKDLVSMMLASRAAYGATRSQSFWKRRLQQDAPWYWEAFSTSSPSVINSYEKEYQKVMMQARRPVELAKRNQHVPGLANRRRIWEVSQQVLEMYAKICPLDPNITAEISSEFQEEARSHYFARVADQKESGHDASVQFFFQTAADMYLEKSVLFFWRKKALGGISARLGDNILSFGDCATPAEAFNVLELSADDWLEKVTLNISINSSSWQDARYNTTKTTYDHFVSGITCHTLSGNEHHFGETSGCKRLLEPRPGHGIIGMRTDWAEGRITRIGIFEHAAGLTTFRPSNDTKRLEFLWRDQLPSQSLRFRDYVTGYWTAQAAWDLAPMQPLLFGTNELDLSTVTGFAASRDLRCFEVHRSDGSKERIGNSTGSIKLMRIDGPGGERISSISVVVGALPVGLVMISNRGRRMVFGKSNDNSVTPYTPETGFGLAGIYCSFAYNSNPGEQLSSLGLVFSPDIAPAALDDAGLADPGGLLWEPQAPPASWRPSDPLYGSQHNGCVLKALDFSRPVKKITGLLAAPAWLDIIELGGFTIHYGEDSSSDRESVFGMTSEVWPTHPEATIEDLQRMKRHDRMSMMLGRKERDPAVAHVASDEEALAQPSTWALGQDGEKIVTITVWAGDYLNGLQFHSESGKSSPRWGACGGEPAGKISVKHDPRVVGARVFLGCQRLGFTACSDVPQAIQAMVTGE
ncbi:hypothetical protein KC332_g9417 [Hortaea werneckii]|uniref:F-box domain-containing protein n=1 Tax=Hortaea werneckii TaxID=91943 RepID=A0A3M7III4_HORWE|nr:hypothetical protein KC350_g10077 [Hortaea werneckii]KAI6979811.1 hypothetical protein KC329_g9889 [Hortaea werneckii]KAI7272115.1 hypothetical protein KC335_g4439 [Hortaea werneckii]KAI7402879.1 hypothetical protein KC332_g9417 [Hortaea werneckii]KAI7429317.1 hypothetical protein KC336_g5237 [Hortaea werneckii]